MTLLLFLFIAAISSRIRAWDEEDDLNFFDEPFNLPGDPESLSQPGPVPTQSPAGEGSGTTYWHTSASDGPEPEGKANEGLSIGAIVGIVIGLLLLLAILIALIWFFTTRRPQAEMSSSSEPSNFSDSGNSGSDAI
jgi:hypothetical protein